MATETLEEGLTRDYLPRRRRPEDQVNNVLLAQARAKGVKTWPIDGRPGFYCVQKSEGSGENHVVQTQRVDDVERAVHCDCKSWQFRATCRHAVAVDRRVGFDLMSD